MTPAGPTLNALLAATALESWPEWYGCTRLAVADYLEDRDLPGDAGAAALVRRAEPRAWAQCPVPPGWEVDEVRLCRSLTVRPQAPWLRVLIDGHGRGDGGFSRLTEYNVLWAGGAALVDGDFLRRFPLRALRLSAVILDESEVSAGVNLRHTGTPGLFGRWADLRLTPSDARLWCRREVLGLFPGVLVKAPCPHCRGTGVERYLAGFVGGPFGRGVLRLKHTRPPPCPVCRGRPPRPVPAPSLLPALPAVALPALAPVN